MDTDEQNNPWVRMPQTPAEYQQELLEMAEAYLIK